VTVNRRNRRVRIAVVLALAAFVAFYAWRTSQTDAGKKACVAGRHEEKDAKGNVTKITNTTCFK
jgi:predicted transcriptional regulator